VETVGATFEIEEGGGFVDLTLPALMKVGGRVRLASLGDLRKVVIPGPVELPSDLEITGCGSNLVVSLPLAPKLGGSLTFSDDGDLSVDLPKLREVVGSVRLRQSTVRVLGLPLLETIGQHLEFDALTGNGLPALPFPALRAVGGNVAFATNQFISALQFPVLATVGGLYGGQPLGSLAVTENPALATVDLGALRQVVLDLVVRGNAALDSGIVQVALTGARVGGKTVICDNLDGLPACQ
jgi:hypothetical protein